MKIFKKLKKLNNKGMTLLELLVCFIVVSSIVISMFNLIMHYQTDEAIESIKSDIIDYKNNITKLVQNDIIKHQLKSVELEVEPTDGEGVEEEDRFEKYTGACYIFKLTFSIPFGNGEVLTSNDYRVNPYEKKLIICTNRDVAEENYIIYQDIHHECLSLPGKNGGGCIDDYSLAPVRYYLPNSDNDATTRFSTIETNINGGPDEGWGTNRVDPITGANMGTTYFYLKATIGNDNLGGNYSINITAPLNYSYCQATS